MSNPLLSECKRCQRCGGRLPESGVLGGGCPRCMLELGYKKEEPELSKGAADHLLPAIIGRYRILRVISEGGMGTVYEAEQEQPRRTVALKIIKRGISNSESLWRFELETEALGRLQHPGIAHIYEAGTVDTGFGPQPYFAMELIHGLQPREFAELHHLDTRQRIELMIKICDAVHHAHQRGLIHRDLKPANILVDGNGQPKILDFGVVRVTDVDTRWSTETKIGQLIGTLPYMSPEQALADPLELDTRTDVYSLGIIFYELLTGRMPYVVSRKVHEAIQTIRDDDPVKISTVNRSFRGDIETIVGTALEKDKTRRYQSVFGLAIDLRRCLTDEPIAARPPSKSYQLWKFARRHKTLAAGAAAIFLGLIAGLTTVSLMLKTYSLKMTEADQMMQMGRTLFGLAASYEQRDFNGDADRPQSSLNPTLTFKKALDLSLQKIPQLHAKAPVEATLRELVADTYLSIGSYSEEKDQLELALALRQSAHGNTDLETLQTMTKLATAYIRLKDYSRAGEFAKKVIKSARNTAGDVDPSLRRAVEQLVFIYGRTPATEELSRGFPQIERLFKDDIIDYQSRKSGVTNPTVQYTVEKLLSLYTDFNPPKYSEAEKLANQIASDYRVALGEGNSLTLKQEKQLLGLYLIPQPQPKLAEAEKYFENLFEAKRSALGDENSATQVTLNYLVSIYLEQGESHYSKAASLLERIVNATGRNRGSESPATRNASIALANVYLKQGRYRDAEILLLPYATSTAVADSIVHPLEVLEQIAVPDQPWPISIHTYGGKPTDLVDTMTRLTILEHPSIVDVLDRLAQTYDKQGRSTEAQETKKKLKVILESALHSTRSLDVWRFGRPLKSMGVMAIRYIEEDRLVDADVMVNDVLDGYRQVAGKSSNAEDVATLLTSAALTYTGKGNYSKAEGLLNSIVKIDEGGASRAFTLSHSLVRLKSWYMDRGRYEDARRIEDRMKEIFPASNQPEQLSTPGTSARWAGVYDSAGFIPK